MKDPMLSTKQAAEFLGISRRTLEKFRMTGGGPRYVAISGRCVRYDPADLEAWLDSKKRVNTHA